MKVDGNDTIGFILLGGKAVSGNLQHYGFDQAYMFLESVDDFKVDKAKGTI